MKKKLVERGAGARGSRLWEYAIFLGLWRSQFQLRKFKRHRDRSKRGEPTGFRTRGIRFQERSLHRAGAMQVPFAAVRVEFSLATRHRAFGFEWSKQLGECWRSADARKQKHGGKPLRCSKDGSPSVHAGVSILSNLQMKTR